MKKILSIIFLLIMILTTLYVPVNATGEEMAQLRLSVLEADEEYKIFMLLPKKYIKYAIQHDGLDIDYDGYNTLIYNTIPSIVVDISKVQEKTYIDNGVEYVQIQLDDLGDGEYLFEIIPEYTDMDMLYRVTSDSRDNIMVIDNFEFHDNACEMEYNYKNNTIQTIQKSEIRIDFKISWWQIVVIAILVICIMFISKRRTY